MDIEIIAAVAGLLLSALFSFVPKLNTTFAALDGTYKRLIMLGTLVAAVLLIWGAGCIGLWGECYEWREVVRAFLAALVANQATYLITPLPAAVKSAQVDGRIGRMGADEDLPK